MKHFLLLAALFISTTFLSQDILTRGEVFDYNVGDEFHYSIGGIPGVYYKRYTVIDREESANNDTLFYQLHLSSYLAGPDGDGGTYETISEDTVTQTYTNLEDSITDFGPNGLIYDIYLDSTYHYYPDSIITYDSSWCNLELNGYIDYPPVFEPPLIRRTWGRGVGIVEKYHYDPSSGGNPTLEDYRLLYYKKGNDSCGEPSTASLPSNIRNHSPVRVYPNPANDIINIDQAQNVIKSISIYDSKGAKMICTFNQTEDNYQLNTLNLSSGMYTLLIELEDKVIYNKVSIIH